jgi:hypothetical protein
VPRRNAWRTVLPAMDARGRVASAPATPRPWLRSHSSKQTRLLSA